MNTAKVVLITGSSAGIGLEMAKMFLSNGFAVVLNGRNQQKLDRAQTALSGFGNNILAISADINDKEECDALMKAIHESYGRLDLVIHNAALATQGAYDSMAPEVIRKVMEVNLLAPMVLSRMALPYLLPSKGSIIFISSIAGIHGVPFNAVYSSSKGALTQLAQALRLELNPAGIHVGIAFLGFVENEPAKEFLTPDGQIITKSKPRKMKMMKREEVARHIFRMYEGRKKKIVLSVLGKFQVFASRFMPWLIPLIFRLNMEKVKRESVLAPAESQDQRLKIL